MNWLCRLGLHRWVTTGSIAGISGSSACAVEEEAVLNSQEQLDFYTHLFDGFKGLLKGRWMPELSKAELHVLQDFLWAAHDDVVSTGRGAT